MDLIFAPIEEIWIKVLHPSFLAILDISKGRSWSIFINSYLDPAFFIVVPKALTRTSVFRSCLNFSRSEKSWIDCFMKYFLSRLGILRRVIAFTSRKSSWLISSRKCVPINPVDPIIVIFFLNYWAYFFQRWFSLISGRKYLIKIDCGDYPGD